MTKLANYWGKFIERYEHENLSKAEFCKQYKLSITSFYYWCNKLRPDLKFQNKPSLNRTENSLFLPVKKEIIEKSVSIVLNDTMKLSFDSLPEPEWIASLIKSMDVIHVQHQ